MKEFEKHYNMLKLLQHKTSSVKMESYFTYLSDFIGVTFGLEYETI